MILHPSPLKSVKGKILLIKLTISMIVLVSVPKDLRKFWINLQFCTLTNEFGQIEEVWKSHNDLLKKEVWVHWTQPGLCISLDIWKHYFLAEKGRALARRAHPQPLLVSHHAKLHSVPQLLRHIPTHGQVANLHFSQASRWYLCSVKLANCSCKGLGKDFIS